MRSSNADVELRLARAAAIALSLGFGFGGFVGILDSDDPLGHQIVAAALLTALLVLHLRNCVRRSDGTRPKGWQATLAAQTVLTAAGMLWFADTWYGNSGFLAAAVLLLIRPAGLAWAGFALIVAAQFVAALPVRPTVGEALYLAVGHAAFVGIALYAIARLADLVTDLRDTRLELAAAEVARQRLEFGRQLNDRVGASLRRVVDDGETMLALPDPSAAGDRLRQALTTARSALNEARSVAHGHRAEDTGPPVRRVAADLTVRTVAALGVATILLMIVPTGVRYVIRADLALAELLLFSLCLITVVACYLRCCTPRRDGSRPRGWPVLLLALAALTVVPLLVFDFWLWHMAYFLPGATLVLLRGPLRWLVTVPLVLLDSVLLVWGAHLGAPTPIGQLYEAVWVAERALLVYALSRMAGLAIRLSDARAELSRAAVVHDRLRFARDLHDLFGYSLSVLVLKSELAQRLLDRDAARARAELAEGVQVARQALADLDEVTVGYRPMSVTAEAQTARAVLTAAGVQVSGDAVAGEWSTEVDTVLATVLREGVTNVLRHSTAGRCELSVTADATAVRLCLTNDGVTGSGPHRAGMGLENLGRRLETLGGRLDAGPRDGGFELVATVPLQPALVGGDPDGVHPVAGVEPGDGRRQVVTHGSHAEE
ncbi:histidine kinase [Actinoplanes sp. NBC_00393]|uniref:sensor histidine kinase n=1 Tax=Actinoplanes sp. NBC_00393 TaxID=2975953 RepID=UPI002E1A3C79